MTVLEVPAVAAISSIPTPAPCVRIAWIVALTSSPRRWARCWSQRVLRPSVVVVTRATVAGQEGTCYRRLHISARSHQRRRREPRPPLQETSRGYHPASRRHPRRQPDPLRPPERRVRQGL